MISVFEVISLLKDAILAPPLDAGQMKGAEAGFTAPDGVVLLQGRYANEAGGETALERLEDGLPGSIVGTAFKIVGLKHFVQDVVGHLNICIIGVGVVGWLF